MKLARFFMIALMGSVLFSSCGSSKKATTESDEVEVQENECRRLARQKPSTRAWGEAINFDMSRAISFAEMNARAKFARAIQAAMMSAQRAEAAGYNKGTTDGENGMQVGDDMSKNNDMNQSIAEREVKNTVVIKDQIFKMKDGRYHAYVTLEYSGDVAEMATQIANKVKQQISDDERMKMNFEFKKFREDIEKELEKMKSE